MRGLKSGCCGNTTVHLCLLLGQPVYSLKPKKPQKPTEEDTGKKEEEDSRSKLVLEEVDL